MSGYFRLRLVCPVGALSRYRTSTNDRFAPAAVVRECVWREPDCSVVINNTLTMERRGGRGGGGAPMLVRPVGRDQRPWNKGLLVGQNKPLEPKHAWCIRVRLEIARSWRDLVIFNL